MIKTRRLFFHSSNIGMFFMILGVLAIVAIGLTACNGPTGPIDFEDPPLGANYYVLDTFTDSGFTMIILPFQWGNGQWTMASGVDYPRLTWENTGLPNIPPAAPLPLAGLGTEEKPYQTSE